MIKITICDDSSQHVNELLELLKVFAERMNIEAKFTSYSSGKAMLFAWENSAQYADILYLDIDMPLIDGIRVAEKLRDKGFNNEIIFYTRSDNKALEAFDVNAFHYIVKEATGTRKAEEIFRGAVRKMQRKNQEFISFSCAGENRSIAIESISRFQVDGRIVTVHYEQGKTFEFYAALAKLEDALCQKGFIRISRTELINVKCVKSNTAQTIELTDGTQLEIGRNYRKHVKEELAYWAYEVNM
jgi:Response regulator of the LytR/AlgR family